MRRSDLVFIAVFVALAAGSIGLDRLVQPRQLAGDREAGGVVSRATYCPSPDATEAAMATTNLGRKSVTLRRLAIAGAGETATEPVALHARRRSSVVVSQLAAGQAVGVAESFGGETTTDLQVSAKERGITGSACSSRPGERWLFGSASTTRRHDHFLLVANPFQEEAVIRVRIMAPERDFVPVLLRDRVIPPLSQVALLLADFIAETPSFGMDVRVMQGRLVISRYAQIATREGLRGISLDVGAEMPSASWLFASGEVPGDGEETIFLANPGTSEALVEVTFQTDKQTVALDRLKEVAVPAGRQVAVKVSDFLPRGTKHSTRVIATNDIAIVAERTTVSTVPGGRGYQSTVGIPAASRRWAISAGALPAAQESLAIVGAGRRTVPVKITVVTDRGTASPSLGVKAFPDRRSTLDLEPLLARGAATILAESSGVFALESDAVAGSPYADLGGARGQALGD